MEKHSDWVNYDERLQRVNACIYDHLENDIDLNQLAEVACLSPYHYRVDRTIQGKTIAATVKRLRLERAAGRLAHSVMTIGEKARRAGYGSIHAFSRTFCAAYGMPPAAFRKNGSHILYQNPKGAISMVDYKVEIKDIPPLKLAALPHKGSYLEIGKEFELLGDWLASRNLVTPETRIIGIYYDDPESVPIDELRSYAGIVVDDDFVIEAPLEKQEISGGPCAVLSHTGPYSDLPAAYQWFYAQWLDQSGREAADAPPFEEYLNSPQDTPPTELLTEIHIPLR